MDRTNLTHRISQRDERESQKLEEAIDRTDTTMVKTTMMMTTTTIMIIVCSCVTDHPEEQPQLAGKLLFSSSSGGRHRHDSRLRGARGQRR